METQKQKTHKAVLVGGLLVGSFLLVFALVSLLPQTASSAELAAQGGAPSWDTVFTETFESGIGSEWDVFDENGADGGEYYWATTSITASEGITSAWATGGGAEGATLQPGTDDYPNNALSYMIRGPVDLSGTNRARLSFDYWAQTAEQFDALQVQLSTDDSTYTAVMTISGDSDGWQTEVLDVSDYAGEEEVWISFFFNSNASNTDLGVYVDNIILETRTETGIFLPVVSHDPSPTPTSTPTSTPTATPPPYYYYDDFSDSDSGWPVVDNTHVSNDCFRWFYEDGDYKVDICDDRTDVKVSPLVPLPDGDYEIEVDARFRHNGGWWTSYGIIFDGKDDPDPNNPDLGDYYMIWVLWEGQSGHRWKLLKDVPGDQEDVTSWALLPDSAYNYGTDGLAWNTWRIVRTEDRIRVYVNGHELANVGESRPRTNQQILFGLFASTYETGISRAAFDDFLVTTDDPTTPAWMGTPQPFYDVGDFEMVPSLPQREE